MVLFTVTELILIGGLSLAYWMWDTPTGEDPNASRMSAVQSKVTDNRIGAQSDPTVVNQKELEAIKRGVALPERSKDNPDPSAYEAELDTRLDESRDYALAMAPMRPDRMVEYGTPSWRNAGKVLTDYLYWKYPREGPKPPVPDSEE
jgi:hypothetical protein